MKNCIFPMIALLWTMSCTTKNEVPQPAPKDLFTSELGKLKEYFKIPGLAVLVQQGDSTLYEDYFGYADRENQKMVDSTTQFPIASITKVFSAVALLQLQEQGKLTLDTPITAYIPKSHFGDTIQIDHILSHTSQGIPGKHFYYSYRFGTLTSVIEKAADTSFTAYLEQAIFEPLQLRQTYFLSDSSTVTATTARPYDLGDVLLPGKIEYGVSASAGIVSSLGDLVKFSRALDDVLLKESSRIQMFAPFQPKLPYGYGIFSQKVAGKQLLWAYGQYDSYSSLFLKVPELDLTLVLLANNNLMSDPARLINGDITSSLFALSFLKNFVWDFHDILLFEDEDMDTKFADGSKFYQTKLLAEALAASYMGRFDTLELSKSKRLLRKNFIQYPNYVEYADLNLLHTLTFIKSVHFHRELGPFNAFDPQIEAIGNQLLSQDPDNPYAHVYLGEYFDGQGEPEKARFHFEALAKAENFSPFWYTATAKQWLAEH
ncbi:MAG: serine hydrolase domain-containing protein [Bacteroidota bacterium]